MGLQVPLIHGSGLKCSEGPESKGRGYRAAPESPPWQLDTPPHTYTHTFLLILSLLVFGKDGDSPSKLEGHTAPEGFGDPLQTPLGWSTGLTRVLVLFLFFNDFKAKSHRGRGSRGRLFSQHKEGFGVWVLTQAVKCVQKPRTYTKRSRIGGTHWQSQQPGQLRQVSH